MSFLHQTMGFENSFHVDNFHQGALNEFEAVFDFAMLGIIITDANGRVVNINRFAEAQFGYEKGEVLGEKIEMLMPPDSQKAHVALRERYFKNPIHRPMGTGRDLYGKRKDGTVFPAEVNLSYFTANSNQFVIALIIDISRRKENEATMLAQKNQIIQFSDRVQKMSIELEQRIADRTKILKETLLELEKQQAELAASFEKEKQLVDLKSRFVTMASHEFRTPLSTILSSVSLIAKYPNTEDAAKRDKHINRIKQAVGNMNDILEDFLSLGKMDENKVELQLETATPTMLLEFINGTVEEMQRLAKQGQQINYTQQVKQPVSFDRKMLRHVLTNLVSNAIKFSFEFSEITIQSIIDDGDLVFSVADTGIGISEQAQKHLFERFFRAENASNIQGTGLGLHIVGRYIDLAGGRMKMKSKLNEGTTFTFSIPQHPDRDTSRNQ